MSQAESNIEGAEPTVPPPFPGVDELKWRAVVVTGSQAGHVHAETLMEAMLDIELTGDVLATVTAVLDEQGIKVDDDDVDAVDDDADTPPSGTPVPAVADPGAEDDAAGLFPAHWDPKLRIPRGQVVAAASIVSPKY